MIEPQPAPGPYPTSMPESIPKFGVNNLLVYSIKKGHRYTANVKVSNKSQRYGDEKDYVRSAIEFACKPLSPLEIADVLLKKNACDPILNKEPTSSDVYEEKLYIQACEFNTMNYYSSSRIPWKDYYKYNVWYRRSKTNIRPYKIKGLCEILKTKDKLLELVLDIGVINTSDLHKNEIVQTGKNNFTTNKSSLKKHQNNRTNNEQPSANDIKKYCFGTEKSRLNRDNRHYSELFDSFQSTLEDNSNNMVFIFNIFNEFNNPEKHIINERRINPRDFDDQLLVSLKRKDLSRETCIFISSSKYYELMALRKNATINSFLEKFSCRMGFVDTSDMLFLDENDREYIELFRSHHGSKECITKYFTASKPPEKIYNLFLAPYLIDAHILRSIKSELKRQRPILLKIYSLLDIKPVRDVSKCYEKIEELGVDIPEILCDPITSMIVSRPVWLKNIMRFIDKSTIERWLRFTKNDENAENTTMGNALLNDTARVKNQSDAAVAESSHTLQPNDNVYTSTSTQDNLYDTTCTILTVNEKQESTEKHEPRSNPATSWITVSLTDKSSKIHDITYENRGFETNEAGRIPTVSSKNCENSPYNECGSRNIEKIVLDDPYTVEYEVDSSESSSAGDLPVCKKHKKVCYVDPYNRCCIDTETKEAIEMCDMFLRLRYCFFKQLMSRVNIGANVVGPNV